MRVTALILLLASVAAPLAHRECSMNHGGSAAAERHHAPHAPGHTPSHQPDARAECTMVGSGATVAVPLDATVIGHAASLVALRSAQPPHTYRDPQLATLKPPPRFTA